MVWRSWVAMPDAPKRPCCVCRRWFRPDHLRGQWTRLVDAEKSQSLLAAQGTLSQSRGRTFRPGRLDVGPGPDGREDARVVHVRQVHESVPVAKAEARVFFRAGRIDAFAGNLADIESSPKRVSRARGLQRIAEDFAGHPLAAGKTEFDADLNRHVIRFSAEDRGPGWFDYVLDEATGELLAKEDAGQQTQKPIQSLDYAAGWNPSGPTQKTVEMTITPVSGGLFSHELRNPAPGAPTNTYHSFGTFFPGQNPPCNTSRAALISMRSFWKNSRTYKRRHFQLKHPVENCRRSRPRRGQGRLRNGIGANILLKCGTKGTPLTMISPLLLNRGNRNLGRETNSRYQPTVITVREFDDERQFSELTTTRPTGFNLQNMDFLKRAVERML
jgi:hypothetical protein